MDEERYPYYPESERTLNTWLEKLGLYMTQAAKTYLLKYYNYDSWVLRDSLEKIYVRSYKRLLSQPQVLTSDDVIYYLEREPSVNDFGQKQEHTDEQWCPTCRCQLELAGDAWKCRTCGYSILLSDTDQGYGYPTLESTYYRPECMTCFWREICENHWCWFESSCDDGEEYFASKHNLFPWGNGYL